MRFIFIVLFMVSFGSVSMAGVGDVYYCEMTVFGHIKNHEFTRYSPEKFKFIWGDKKMKLVSNDGYFGTWVYDIDFQSKTTEWFTAFNSLTKTTRVSFNDRTFHYTQTLREEIFSISAKCDKF